MNFSHDEYSDFKERAIQLVIKGEYIKRKFEQEYEDIEWFINNWDLPLKKRKVFASNFLKSCFLSEMIQIQYRSDLGQKTLLSPLMRDFENLAHEILVNDKEWFNKMYNISCLYKICAPELAIPMDFKEFLKLDHEKQLKNTHIPNFLENQSKHGFLYCGVEEGYESKNIGVFFVDLLYSEYDLSKVLIEIKKNLCLLRRDLQLDLTPKESKFISEMPKISNDSSTYSNSTRGKLFGLLQWDLHIQGKELSEIREIFRELNFLDCHNNGSCYAQKDSSKQCKNIDNCKSKIDNQRQTTRKAIVFGQHVSTSSPNKQLKNESPKGLRVPRDVSYLEDGCSFSAS